MKRTMFLQLMIMLWLLTVPKIVHSQMADGIYYESPTTSPTILRSWDYHIQLQDDSPFSDLAWRNVGPTRQGGRVSAIACPAPDSSTIYVSIGTAGIWKTNNNGASWQQLFTHEATFAVGDLAIAPTDPDIIWVGSGEGSPPRSGYAGCGVFKSTNGGKSWQNMGLHDTQHIGRIVIDPENPDIVYVAALGHVYTTNRNRGLFKTTDGGRTWNKILYIDNKTGVIDLVMDPQDNQTLYAAAWDQIRHAWDYVSGGPGSGIYKTTDGGATWRHATEGLPQGAGVGRIGLAVAPSNPQVVYAACLDVDTDSGEPGVYRSDDKGQTWRKVNENRMSSGIWYYFGDIRVSPDNEDQVYVLTVSLQRSDDGGKTFQAIGRGTHADHHALWIDPANPYRVLDGNDGGFYISHDRGETFEHINNMSIGEFYAVSVDMAQPYNIYGGLQDNGCMMGSSAQQLSYDQPDQWRRTGGGDGFITFADPSDSDIIYTESQFGAFRRNGGQGRGSAPREPELRRNWMSPYIISPHNPSVLYFGAQKLFKSLNKGGDWVCISDDLSKFRPERQGNVPHATLTTLSESPLRRGLIYAGTDDGNVWITPDDGESWELINQGLPDLWVSRVVASNFDVGTVYVTLTGYREDNFKPYIYKSTDFGRNWVSLESNLPIEAINVIREDPHQKNILYVGTELGVYTTLDGGAHWVSLCAGLPTMPVHDLAVHPRENDLIIGTHARGVWILDDLEQVQDFTAADIPRTERPDLIVEEEPEVGVDIRLVRRPQRERNLVRRLVSEQKQDVQQKQVTRQKAIIVEQIQPRKKREIREIYPHRQKNKKIAPGANDTSAETPPRTRVREIREVYPHRPKLKSSTVMVALTEIVKPKNEPLPKKRPRVIREIRRIRRTPISATKTVSEPRPKIRAIREAALRSKVPPTIPEPIIAIRQIKETRPLRPITRTNIIAGAKTAPAPPTAPAIKEIPKSQPAEIPAPRAAPMIREIKDKKYPDINEEVYIERVIREQRAPTPRRIIYEVRPQPPSQARPEIRENPGNKKITPTPQLE